jgi:ketosteroid isomerase-like protein
MSEENVDIVRRIYEAWNSTDPGFELFDPSFELHQGASLPGSAGVFRGHDGMLQAAQELFSGLRDLSWKPDDFVAAPDGRVVVPFRFRATGRSSGVQVEVSLIHVWTLRDDLITLCETYEGPEGLAEALEAAGLSD